MMKKKREVLFLEILFAIFFFFLILVIIFIIFERAFDVEIKIIPHATLKLIFIVGFFKDLCHETEKKKPEGSIENKSVSNNHILNDVQTILECL